MKHSNAFRLSCSGTSSSRLPDCNPNHRHSYVRGRFTIRVSGCDPSAGSETSRDHHEGSIDGWPPSFSEARAPESNSTGPCRKKTHCVSVNAPQSAQWRGTLFLSYRYGAHSFGVTVEDRRGVPGRDAAVLAVDGEGDDVGLPIHEAAHGGGGGWGGVSPTSPSF